MPRPVHRVCAVWAPYTIVRATPTSQCFHSARDASGWMGLLFEQDAVDGIIFGYLVHF